MTTIVYKLNCGYSIVNAGCWYTRPPEKVKKNKRHKEHVKSNHNFMRPFIAFATAKLDFAMTCRDSFVTSRKFWTSLSLFACSLSSRKISFPSCADAGGKLSLHTATILDTIVMICVKFSFRAGGGVGLRTPDRTL